MSTTDVNRPADIEIVYTRIRPTSRSIPGRLKSSFGCKPSAMSQSITFNPVEDAELKAEVASTREHHPKRQSRGQEDGKSRLSWSWVKEWIDRFNTGTTGPGCVRKRCDTGDYHQNCYIKWSTGKMRTKEPPHGLIKNLRAFVDAHRDFTNETDARHAVREAKKAEAEARKNEAAAAAIAHMRAAATPTPAKRQRTGLVDGTPTAARQYGPDVGSHQSPTTMLHSSEKARRGWPILKPERPAWA